MDETKATGPAEGPGPDATAGLRAEASKAEGEVRARCGWREGGTFRECAALILNVSESGALVAADEMPPEDVAILLRLEGGSPQDWIETRAVQVFRTRHGPHKLGLAFSAPCPPDFFAATVFGALP